MKHLLLFGGWFILAVLLSSLLTPVQAQPVPSCQWMRGGGGIANDTGGFTAVDSLGNDYVAGYFEGTATFGNTTLVSQSQQDLFLAKYNPQGQLLWIRQSGGPISNGKAITNLAVDAAGNAYLTGYFGYSPTGNQGSSMVIGNSTLTAGSYITEIFIAKYDPQGNALWARQTVAQQIPSASWGGDIAINSVGDVYLTGSIGPDARLDQFSLSSTVGINNNLFLAKYNRLGVLQWVKTGLGEAASGKGTSAQVAVDANDQPYLIGHFYNSLALGSFLITTNTNNPWQRESYMAKFDAQGNPLWVRQFATSALNANGLEGVGCRELLIDPVGNLVISFAWVSGTIYYDGHTFVSLGQSDCLLLKCTPQGQVMWSKQLGGSSTTIGEDSIQAATVDASGNIYLAIWLSGMPTLVGPSTGTTLYSHLLSYTPAGNLRWVRSDAPSLPNTALRIALAASHADELYLTGYFYATKSLDNLRLVSAGGYDVFTAKLAFAAPSPAIGPIPNIITPNGDAQNETFRLPGLPTGPWQINIYNRWGARVYHSDDYRQDWNAPSLPDGQYYYYLQAPTRAALKGWLEVIH